MEESGHTKSQITVDNEDGGKNNDGRWTRCLGLLLTLLSALMFSINSLLFKMLNYNPPLVPGMIMFLGTALLTLPLLVYNYMRHPETIKRIRWTSYGIMLARAVSGCSGMVFFFYALQYMSMADALIIACSSTIFVFLLAFIFLKESCGFIPVLTIALALIGVGIITRPPLLTGQESFNNEDLIGSALAFCSMICIATTLVLMRYLQDVHHSLINFVLGIWGTLQTMVLALVFAQLDFPKNVSEWGKMLAMGFVFFVGQSFLALGLQLEEAGPVSLVRMAEVIFAAMWQIIFLHVVPDVFSISGTILILIGILTTILRKWIGSLPDSHALRSRLRFLLK